MEIKQEEHPGAGAFYLEEDGNRLGEMRYLIRHGVMNIYHTGVDPSLKGRNMGHKLVEAGVNYARQIEIKILPTCPFARSVFERTEAFRDVIADT
ncbi:MAG TPA: GNAT family N-acetyltransferase [Mucilaginibacter sp.]|nr:GNAT family N-acetyltransferase [Mucilaginibacter sp.]